MKRVFDISISFLLLIFLIPLWLILFLVLKIFSPGPFIFTQLRMGKNSKPFKIYKIRTMIRDAEEKKKSLLKFNEVQAPVFKIKNDPRFIKFGKVLSSTGLDESIQVLNVLKGEMSLVGPRPLPISEAKKLPIKYKKRFSSLPGITSEWVIEGAHHMSLKQWMNLDLEYVKKGNIFFDCYILFATLEIISKKLINYGKEINKKPSPPKD